MFMVNKYCEREKIVLTQVEKESGGMAPEKEANKQVNIGRHNNKNNDDGGRAWERPKPKDRDFVTEPKLSWSFTAQ